MKLSVKSDYAVRAIFGLARHHHEEEACRVEILAQEQAVPANYLVQILIELKSARIVQSLRGKDGGYRLARPPGDITLAEVLRCVHGQLFESPALTDPRCAPELRAAWKHLQHALTETAESLNFQQLLEASVEREKMYYI
ncbi:MAG: Rrf2 family transcriptional regulator [Verrucomicrobia bacterium]|nr:Rrf2 family transcriptional regulator [Verrucomicrobiota bacterium]